jgi:hypothetical protein
MSKNTRRLKVYYGHHSNSYKPHPYIRLAGKYLTMFDFKIGDFIELDLDDGLIIITRVRPEPHSGAHNAPHNA